MASRPGRLAGAAEDSGTGTPRSWSADDQAEWENFFNDHYETLLTAGVVWGGNTQDAEDAAEFAMIELRRRWHAVNNRAAYARRVAINYITRAQRHSRREIAKLVATGEFVTPCYGDDGLAHYENVQWVRYLLDCLPREQRRVMERLYDGLSYAEIAQQLGKSEANVRKHLQLARARLREALDMEGCGPIRLNLDATRKEAIR